MQGEKKESGGVLQDGKPCHARARFGCSCRLPLLACDRLGSRYAGVVIVCHVVHEIQISLELNRDHQMSCLDVDSRLQ